MKSKLIPIVVGILVFTSTIFGVNYITRALQESSEEIVQSRSIEDILMDVYNMTAFLVGDSILEEALAFTEDNINNLMIELNNSDYYYKPSLIDGLNEWKEGNFHRLTALRNFTGNQLSINKTYHNVAWENLPEWAVELAKENGYYPQWLESGYEFDLWEDALQKFASMDYVTEEDKVQAAIDILSGMEFETEEEWEEAFQKLMNYEK